MRQQVLPDEFGPVMRMLPPLLSVRSLGTGRAPVQLCSGSMASRKRKVSSSLFVYSTAAPSGEFDHADLEPNNLVYTPGTTVSFTATGGSNLYAPSKASVSFDAAKYYQSTVKMGKVIEVFEDDDPILEDFTRNPSYKYLHIGLEQAYAIARQLSTQNTGATVAVVYNNENRDVTYALSSDASATARTIRGNSLFANNYRVFLATLWEDAD